MAFHSLRLRRVFPVCSSLLRQSLAHRSKQIPPIRALSHLLSNTGPSSTDAFGRRPFTSTTSMFQSQRNKVFDPETDEIGPDTILFEGCDYNHWLITVDFPKDEKVTREQMIDTYVNTAAQVFGSVEEAKKNIYALSTTTYQGFQVVCSEETSEKFKGLPGVVFVLPDSYIDPANKQYGGDKYVNGEIFPRPPPVHYGRTTHRNRQPQQQNYGPPTDRDNRQPRQQNYGPPPPHQNYGPPPPQQNFGPPPPQQNFGPPPPQQNFGPPPPQQNYRPPPQQNLGPPPPQQNYGPPPPQQNYGPPPPQQNYGPPPPQQNFGPSPPRQNFGPPPPRQNYGPPPPQQNYGPPPPQQNYRPLPPQQNYGPPPPQQNYGPPPPQKQPNFPPRQNYGPLDSGERRGPMPPQNNASGEDGSYNGNFNQRNSGQV